MGVEALLFAAVQTTEKSLNRLPCQQMIEIGAPAEQGLESSTLLGGNELTEQLEEICQLRWGETLHQQAIDELGGARRAQREELIEECVVLTPSLLRIGHHARDGLAQGRTIGKADLLRGARRVDGLRRR